MSSPREHWGLSCPNGGKFYICEEDDTQFVGCCVSDPCGTNKGKCPDGDLRATTFDKDLYAELPTQDCDSSQGTDNWYTCAFLDPPFLGCCSQNACGSGCPRNRLVGAKLSEVENNRLDFLEPRANTTETTASTATSTSSSTSEPTSDSDDSGLSTGATAGIAVGAAVGGLLVIALLAWIFWWKPRQKKKNGQEFQSVPANPPMAGHPGTPGTFNTQPTFPVQSPMSTYQRKWNKLKLEGYYADISQLHSLPPLLIPLLTIPAVFLQWISSSTLLKQPNSSNTNPTATTPTALFRPPALGCRLMVSSTPLRWLP